jgi:uncharacterized membrane protein
MVWSLVHLVPSVAPALKQDLSKRLGEKAYKGIFALLIIAGLVMIVFGWRNITPAFLYQLPMGVSHFAKLLVLFAFILMGAANYPTRIKNVIRHPQLTGVIVWACAHLLLNGDSRSVLLFGWLGLWALLEIILINRRDGEWVKLDPPPVAREIRGLLISLVVFVVFVLIHPYIAGVPIY